MNKAVSLHRARQDGNLMYVSVLECSKITCPLRGLLNNAPQKKNAIKFV